MAFIEDYCRHVSESGMFTEAEITKLCDRELIASHSFYINLPQLFSPAYPQLPFESYAYIRWISYGFLRSLLSLDNVIDEGNIDQIKFSFFNYEVATKGMAKLFLNDNSFWHEYALIRKTFFNSIDDEKLLSENDVLNEEVFLEIAKGKSIFVTLVPAMLGKISKSEKNTRHLKESLLSLHAGIQLIDDIEDFESDLENGQYTYAAWKTLKYLERQQIDIKFLSNAQIYKYFIASGAVFKCLELAEKQFSLAKEYVKSINVEQYKEYIENIGPRQTARLRKSLHEILNKNKQ